MFYYLVSFTNTESDARSLSHEHNLAIDRLCRRKVRWDSKESLIAELDAGKQHTADPDAALLTRSFAEATHGAELWTLVMVLRHVEAMQTFTWSATKKLLAERGVELLSAGLDEVPGVYKDIHAVMAAQTDLVEVLGQFDPKLVTMCPASVRERKLLRIMTPWRAGFSTVRFLQSRSKFRLLDETMRNKVEGYFRKTLWWRTGRDIPEQL